MPVAAPVAVAVVAALWGWNELRKWMRRQSAPGLLPAATDAATVLESPHAPTVVDASNDAPVRPPCAPSMICGGGIVVSGQDFVSWFNSSIKGRPGFQNAIQGEHFRNVFDNVEHLWAPAITLEQFVAFFCIFYNETGGSFKPVSELGGPKYCFETKLPNGGTKQSYNKHPNRLCGNQLAERGIGADVAAWNGQVWPGGDAAKASEECDYYKFRGRGLIQTTWRSNYISQVDPLLKKAGLKTCDEMTTKELDEAVLKNPPVYLGMVRAFFSTTTMAAAFAKVDQDPPVWAPTGKGVSGSGAYGSGIYTQRCQTLYDAMRAGGYESTSARPGASSPAPSSAKPAPALLALLAQIDSGYPKRSKISDGMLSDDHQSELGPHDMGNALDITLDPVNGPDLDQLFDVLNQDMRTHVLIWNRKLANHDRGGVVESADGMSPHTRHLHIEIYPSTRDDARPWPQSALAPAGVTAPPAKIAPSKAPDDLALIIKGGMESAWTGGLVDNIRWKDIIIGGYRLSVTQDALSVRGVRLPSSFDDALNICAGNDFFPPTREICDARFAQADIKVDSSTAPPTNDPKGEKFGDVDQTMAHHARLPSVDHEGRLLSGPWKEWILDPGVQPGRSVNYGYQKSQTPGDVWQKPGHHHDSKWRGYSQLLTLCRRRCIVVATGETVDALAIIAKGGSALGGPLPAWLFDKLNGGAS